MSHYRVSHTRSASWSPQREFIESSLGEPLRNVLREYVPSALIQNNDNPPPNHEGTAAVNMGEEDDERDNTNTPGNFDFSVCLTFLKQVLPFGILLLLRWTWEHRTGIVVLVGLLLTFLHFNKTITRHVSLRDRRHVSTIVANMAFLALNVHVVYYVFHSEKLYRCLYFFSPEIGNTLWDVLWAVGIIDFMVRFAVMFLKCLCIVQWRCLVPYKSRGKWYMLLEHIAQFYRTLLPAPRWLSFFLSDNQGFTMGLTLSAIYTVIKLVHIFSRFTELCAALRFFFRDQYYGNSVSHSELTDTQCPICQEEVEDPIRLHCNHVFCEGCITSWLDRHPTCPMCRARITTQPPIWRDGSTSAFVQFF